VARLLIDGEWFDSISPESIYESDFEELLLSNAGHLYPGFFAARFKATVESEHGRAKADRALIDKIYRTWWVVEVELGSHPLRGHVQEQVAVLSTAKYGEREAEALAAQSDELDREALLEMMRGRQPRVLVIVNQAKPDWMPALARYDALVGVAELFRSRRDHMSVLRINGEHPEEIGDIVSMCRVDGVVPNSLRVDSPANLGFGADERTEIWFDGSLTEWARLDSATTAWLVPVRRNPLPSGPRSFSLRRGDDGRLVLDPQT
jgi:hypothetical protein